MQMPAVAPEANVRIGPSRLEVLLADDDARFRALLGVRVSELHGDVRVLEAENGAEAIRIGLQRRPCLALLDVQMPRLGGIEAAITLRELCPQMRLALHTADARAHRDRAREQRLPLLDKLDPDAAVRWIDLQLETPSVRRRLQLRR